MIQALNKKSNLGTFDKNDEVISEILCRMIYNQLKQSMEYSEFANYDYKLKKIINSIHKFYLEDNIIKLISCCCHILITLFTTENISIFFVNPEDDKYYKYFKGETFVIDISLGIVGYVLKSNTHYYCYSTYNNSHFNPIVDIDTSLPLITYPINDKNNGMNLATLQIEYTMTKLSLGDKIEKKIDTLDLEIISLLAINMSSSLSHLRFKVKNTKKQIHC